MQLSELEVVNVSPCHVPPSCPPGMWPCGNCGEHHPVQRNWIVTFVAQPFESHNQTMVCEDCADELRRRGRRSQRDQAAETRRQKRAESAESRRARRARAIPWRPR